MQSREGGSVAYARTMTTPACCCSSSSLHCVAASAIMPNTGRHVGAACQSSCTGQHRGSCWQPPARGGMAYSGWVGGRPIPSTAVSPPDGPVAHPSRHTSHLCMAASQLTTLVRVYHLPGATTAFYIPSPQTREDPRPHLRPNAI